MTVDILERPDTNIKEKEDSGESNQFAHYAEKNEITEAYVFGNPIIALCGKIFVPSRDPNKFPLCPACKEIADSLFFD